MDPRNHASLALAALLASACANPMSAPAGAPSVAVEESATVPDRSLAGGPVVAVGGGGTPDVALEVMLDLAGANGAAEPVVLVVPNASQREDRGVGSAEMWREAGAAAASVMSEDAEAAADEIGAADIVWMSGGDQDRLLDDLERLGLVDDVLAAHARGAVVGGTSAGAAVLGSRTIAGAPEPSAYHRGALPGRDGLGLLPGVIVDQHFAERRREGRLITALLDAPESVAIGVGEGTAAVVEGSAFHVVGRGVVLHLDATEAEVRFTDTDARQSARGLLIDVIAPPDPKQPLWR